MKSSILIVIDILDIVHIEEILYHSERRAAVIHDCYPQILQLIYEAEIVFYRLNVFCKPLVAEGAL